MRRMLAALSAMISWGGASAGFGYARGYLRYVNRSVIRFYERLSSGIIAVVRGLKRKPSDISVRV